MSEQLLKRMESLELPVSYDEILARPEMKSVAFSARLAGKADALHGKEFDFGAFMNQKHGGVVHEVYRESYVETRDKIKGDLL